MKKSLLLNRLLIITLLGFLPFFSYETIDLIFIDSRPLIYPLRLLIIILGPLPQLIYGPSFYYFAFFPENQPYLSLLPYILLIFLLVVGIWNFKKSFIFRIFFGIGALLWFSFGFFGVSLFQLTVQKNEACQKVHHSSRTNYAIRLFNYPFIRHTRSWRYLDRYNLYCCDCSFLATHVPIDLSTGVLFSSFILFAIIYDSDFGNLFFWEKECQFASIIINNVVISTWIAPVFCI